jgi:glycosyltransferase involved in cell wall biosynthesis
VTPLCRIYLFTYKRNELLKRAVDSLLNQTFTNWTCELHNDLPGDTFPEEFINSLNDDRFIVINHSENFGTTRSFNFAYGGCIEKYASILEDDNWWEPAFLEEMIHVLDENPALDIVWSNMQIWKENDDHTFTDTGTTIWPSEKDVLFKWPQPQQVFGCLHSTGAMLYRGSKASDYIIPTVSLSNAVELIRERSFKHPLFLSAKVLANFSRTIESSQSKTSEKWVGTAVMMLSSYILSFKEPVIEFQNLLGRHRSNKPSMIPAFFLSALFYLKKPGFFNCFTIADWFLILKWLSANSFKRGKLRRYLAEQKETWEFLKNKTAMLASQNQLQKSQKGS